MSQSAGTGDIVAGQTGGDKIQPDIAEQETGIAGNEGPRHPCAKSVRDGNVMGEHAEHEIGDDRRGGDSDLHREDRVIALGVRGHGNGEDRTQAQRHRHSKLPDDPFGASLRIGEQRLRPLVHAPSNHFVPRLGLNRWRASKRGNRCLPLSLRSPLPMTPPFIFWLVASRRDAIERNELDRRPEVVLPVGAILVAWNVIVDYEMIGRRSI